MKDRIFYSPAFVHERWADLPDSRLVALFGGRYEAEIFAKAMARADRGDGKRSYVVTDSHECSQFAWTRENVAIADAKQA